MVVINGLKSVFQGLFLSSKRLKEGNYYHKTVLLKVEKEVNESLFYLKTFISIERNNIKVKRFFFHLLNP